MSLQHRTMTLHIEADTADVQRRMFFNAFAVNRTLMPGLVVMDFAFLHEGDPVEGYRAVIEAESLQAQSESYLKFLKSLDPPDGTGGGDLPPYHKPGRVDSVNIMGLARHGALGEVTLHSFSWKAALESGRAAEDQKPKPIKASFAALLCCQVETLTRFIITICDDRKNSTHHQTRPRGR